MTSPHPIPVIIGIGEVLDRPADPFDGKEPVDLMLEALKRADTDAGGGFLARVDSISVVNEISWGYETEPVNLVCEALSVSPAFRLYGPVGGESPIRMLHEAAARIAAGESRIAMLCGAESQQTLTKVGKDFRRLKWRPGVPFPARKGGATYTHPLAVKLGLARPITVYPIYENATLAAWGQTPREAREESGALWSRYAAVAAENPNSWLKKAYTAEEIITPSHQNRPIAWPYTKLMVANNTVNQGAALVVTSLAEARARGIPEDKLVFVWGGAASIDHRDFMQRAQFHRSDAQEVVLRAAQRIAEQENAAFDAIELYSCFPVVPKMTRRILGLGDDVVPTVTGGLTFHGAPLNAYMAHAACGMVRHLREHRAHTGLLYGQGGFVTSHHSLVVGTRPSPSKVARDDGSAQKEIEGKRPPSPVLREQLFEGRGTIESFTVIYDRDGAPEQGVVVLRLSDDSRTVARVRRADADAIALLTNLDRSPIGTIGELSKGADEIAEYHPSTTTSDTGRA